uniref:Notch receptor 2 n=1 Tax=Cyprinus carpio TaxID=7962 RepID=A0A8C2AFT3_CYPCA
MTVQLSPAPLAPLASTAWLPLFAAALLARLVRPNPCEHGGSCKNTEGSFTCNCAPGYTGPRCEQDINECGSNPCQNDATCLDQIGDYNCICMPGFTGTLCTDNINDCEPKPCHHGDCIDGIATFTCECYPGYMGPICSEQIRECQSDPCQNRGRCVDLVNMYQCNCQPGTSGEFISPVRTLTILSFVFVVGVNCEINHDDCASNPCQHGTCEDGINEYKCVCKPGFTGERCTEEINECSSNPCLSGGTCVDKVNGFQCLCPVGSHGPLCHSGADHCSPMPCLHGECFDQQDGYLCACKSGWEGKNCDREKNECQSNPCQNGGTCNDRLNGYTCVCARGFAGFNCEININECDSNPCMNQGTCVDGVNSYICHCTLPYTGDTQIYSLQFFTMILITESDKLVPCDSQPCKRRGVCQPSLDYTSYTCLCHSGWEGAQCTEDVDECKKNPCQNGGHCWNTVGSYRCECQPGYSGVNCQTNIDDCSSNPCRNGGTCVDKVGRFLCECRAGFYGERCEEEVDECASNPCWNGGRCTDYVNSYTCQCPPGYDGISCERDIPDCTETSCLNNGTCVDGINRFTCRCRHGFSGQFCQFELNECDSHPCKNGGTCIDGLGTFHCTCPLIWLINFPDILQSMVNLCSKIECKNGGTCIQKEMDWRCSCQHGWTGLYCDIPNMSCQAVAKNKGETVDKLTNCVVVDMVCKHAGQCINKDNTHQCMCQRGYMGSYCDREVDECLSNPCRNGGTCVDYQGGYDCKCKAGYQGVNCEYDVDECQSNPCRNGGTCIDLTNRFSCACPPGTKGLQCEVDVNECAPEFGVRCKNGGQCVDGVGRYTCSCPPGFTGEHCEGDVNECLSGPCHPSGTIDCVPLTNNYQCRCRLGYTGQHCELMVDLCQSKPCHNSGRCAMNTSSLHGYTCTCQPVSAVLGFICVYTTVQMCGLIDLKLLNGSVYVCVCATPSHFVVRLRHDFGLFFLMTSVWRFQGYTGFNCGDFEIFSCASLHCQNGGQCVEIKGRPQCRCPIGFTGPHCESITNRCMCQNGGTCIPDDSSKFSCRCPPGFSGPTCQTYRPSCPYLECKLRAGDKVCDPQCKNPECEWDGGDCTLHWDKPWKNCTASVPCWDLFHNGHCDPECDNAGCLFDRFECHKGSSAGPTTCKYVSHCISHTLEDHCSSLRNLYDRYCADHYANGHCNQGCNTEACGWDGLDCATDTPPKLAEGTLVIVVLLQPEELLGDLKGFLRSLGTLLHTNLRLKLDEHKRPMVYPYYRNKEDEIQNNIATMKQRGKRELEKEVIGSKVHLEIDNQQCSQHSDECISSADQAAAFIAAESLVSELTYPLYSVGSDKDPVPPMPPLLYLVAVAAAIIVLILLLGVLAAKRKRKHGTLWLPDGFLAKKDCKRREPVGQDDFGMKSMQKPQDGGLMDGSSTHHWSEEDHLTIKPRMEDKPLLPVGVDGGVDRREWTLQHHKAADITLTPPQADVDMDSLDVNVKGPDGFTPLMLASLRTGSSPDCGSMLGDEEEESGADEPDTNVITDLIGQGASLNSQTDRTGETALHLAARYARADAAKRLLDAGADANAHDNMGRTPLHAAVAADAQGVFQILIRNRATDLDARMNDGTTPLILAARLAVEGMVEELVHCHADVNAVDDHGKSALHWAAAVNNVDATLVLLKNGANRDMQDNKEETPLFLAAREGSFEAAQVLLDHYSNRDITDHLDRLPRDTAQERMHHDIVRLLDQYNLVHSPHSGPNHVGNGGGHSSMVCGTNGTGFMIGMRPGPQGKKNRRAGGKANTVAAGTAKDLKEIKAKRRKKPAGGEGPNVVSSVTMSPVDSLESPHSYAGEAVATSSKANSPPLLSSPSVRPMLPSVSHMLGQQQSWVGLAKHSYNGHMFGLMPPHQMSVGHTSMQQHHSPGMLTPMNVTMSREQLPPIVTFQMMAAGNRQSLLKQAQQGQMQAQGQNQAQSQHLHCNQSMMYPMPDVGMQHGLSHTHPHPHGHNHTLPHVLPESQARQVASYQPRQSPVDKYPTPPSQHSYPPTGSEGTTPGHPAHNPSEHPYLTPSPESPDPWSSSSPHSNSDWSDVTTSPTPLGNLHTVPPSRHTHIPEQAQLQPPSQAAQPTQSQQSQRSSVYA